MRGWWLGLAVLLTACGGRMAANPTPALVSITQGVETCGDVIRAAAQHPYCDGEDTVCYAAATYNADAPTENVVERGMAGPLDRVNDTALRLDRRVDDIPNAEHWHSVTVYTQDSVLMTLDGATLSGISTDLNNLELITDAATASCDDAPTTGLLVQTTRSEIVLMLNGARVTVSDTTLIRERDGALLIYALEGVTVVSADGVSRIVRDGEQTSMASSADGLEAPRPAIPFDAVLLSGLPLAGLPQPIQPQPTIDPANPPTATPCSVRAGWTGTYTVQRGDTLVTIAPRFDLQTADLQTGNCIINPNRLQVGTVLRVPTQTTPTPDAPILPTLNTSTEAAPILPTVSTPPSATPTPPTFSIDEAEIAPGACTMLRWSPANAVAVELDGEAVAVSGQQQVCPGVTTVYTLRVRYTDGTVETINRAVAVRRP